MHIHRSCLGATGDANFLEAILNPLHTEHHGMRKWCVEGFNLTRFDLFAVHRSIEQIKV